MKELQSLDAKKAFSENLKKLRLDSEMTQVELSIKTGLTQASLSKLEKGLRWPDHATIEALAKAFRCEQTDITSHPELIDMHKDLMALKAKKLK